MPQVSQQVSSPNAPSLSVFLHISDAKQSLNQAEIQDVRREPNAKRELDVAENPRLLRLLYNCCVELRRCEKRAKRQKLLFLAKSCSFLPSQKATFLATSYSAKSCSFLPKAALSCQKLPSCQKLVFLALDGATGHAAS